MLYVAWRITGAYSLAMTALRARASAVFLLASALPLAAHAQSEDAGAQTVIRRALIEAAQAAYAQQDYPRCIDTAQRAAAIRDTGSLRKLIAECQIASHDYAGALGSAEVCLSILRRDTAATQRAQLIATCERINVEAQQHTGRLTIVTPAPAPEGLRVTIAGNALPAVAWGVPAIVNAGVPLAVEAMAPTFATFRSSVTVTPGGNAEIRVTLTREQPLPSDAHTNSSSGAASTPASTPTTTPPTNLQSNLDTPAQREPPSPPRPRGASPLLIGGAVVGGAGVIVATVGFALAASSFGDYQGRCATPATIELYNACATQMPGAQGSIDAMTAVGFTGVGLGVIGAGLAVYGALASSGREQRSAWRVVPSTNGAAVLGRF